LKESNYAGPNGAGKTTFAEEFLPNEADCPIFVNADLIAAAVADSHQVSVILKKYTNRLSMNGRFMIIHRKRRYLSKRGDTMSSEKLESTAGGKKRDPDFINAEIALKRAARKARQRAQQAGVGVIVLQDGKIMEERPDYI
jgi:predicted kinase